MHIHQAAAQMDFILVCLLIPTHRPQRRAPLNTFAFVWSRPTAPSQFQEQSILTCARAEQIYAHRQTASSVTPQRINARPFQFLTVQTVVECQSRQLQLLASAERRLVHPPRD